MTLPPAIPPPCPASPPPPLANAALPFARIAPTVQDALAAHRVVDMHTHLYPPSFGTPSAGRGRRAADANGLLLWGIDELLTYHYLVAEVFRVVPATVLPYETFWRMDRRAQADHIWHHLFVTRAPLSEACRGVLTTIRKLGLDPSDPTPARWRAWCAEQDPDEHISRVMELAGVASIVMTNNVFDDNERSRWLSDPSAKADGRFRAVLRLDNLLLDWPGSVKLLAEWGYAVSAELTGDTVREVRRFLTDWIERMKAVYLAASLPPSWRYPAADVHPRGRDGAAVPGEAAPEAVLLEAVLAVCAERKLPFAIMLGCRKAANPALRAAGDVGGLSDVESLTNLCAAFPENRFFVTLLARENQHELAVAARKFGNLMPFGCWWFLNNPSLIDEMTRLRFELLGTSFIPQHSDARVLDQLIYKWDHSRQVIGTVLAGQFEQLAATGRGVTADEIRRTVRALFTDNFENFLKG